MRISQCIQIGVGVLHQARIASRIERKESAVIHAALALLTAVIGIPQAADLKVEPGSKEEAEHRRLQTLVGEMLDNLSGKGYEFIRLDELLQATVREAALTEAE